MLILLHQVFLGVNSLYSMVSHSCLGHKPFALQFYCSSAIFMSQILFGFGLSKFQKYNFQLDKSIFLQQNNTFIYDFISSLVPPSRFWEEQKRQDGGSEVLGLFNNLTRVKFMLVQDFWSEYLPSLRSCFLLI